MIVTVNIHVPLSYMISKCRIYLEVKLSKFWHRESVAISIYTYITYIEIYADARS